MSPSSAPSPVRSPAQQARAEHARVVSRLVAQYAAIPVGTPVRLAKRTSNLFRPRTAAQAPGLDVTGLDRVIEVDPVARTADVGGMTSYEDLVDATLAHGLMPAVVPQLKTITIGGAAAGLGIESSSFRLGLPHETVRELEVLTGAGEVVLATPEGEHADLFAAFPNSYGSLGYALRLVIDLVPVQPFVHLRHVRCRDLTELAATIGEIMDTGGYRGSPVHFLDGSLFSATESYLTLGSWESTAPYTSDYTGRQIYYRSVRGRSEDHLTVRDYLWRWDTDWFWCSRAFGAQHPVLRPLWPRRWLRSDVYWKLIRWDSRFALSARLDARRGLPDRERVVQDVEVPLERLPDFLDWFLREVPIRPVWLCPVRLLDDPADADQPAPGAPWPLYPMQRGRDYVNVGFWSSVPVRPGAADGDVNRAVEAAVAAHDGHKSLYSDAYYGEREFRATYGGDVYAAVKRRYDPDSRLLDLYDKAVRRR